MPRFSKDKETLLKALKRCDDDITADDVIDAEESKNESSNNTFLVHVLLEALCGTRERDSERRLKLFNDVYRFLSKSNVLDEQIVLDNLLTTRRKMAFKLLNVVTEMHKTVVPNPTQDLQFLDFMKNFDCVIYQDKYKQTFDEIKVIAEGGFGTVFMAKHKFDGIVYAVKKITFKLKNYSEYSKVIQEVKNIATLNHLNVVSYNNAWIEGRSSQSGLSSEASSSTEGSESGSVNSSLKKKPSCANALHFIDSGSTSQNSRLSEMSKADSFQWNYSDISCETPKVMKGGDFSLSLSNLSFKSPKVILCIQMEYCDCDLRLWLDQRAKGDPLPFHMDEVRIFKDILNGVAHIHSKSIIHRDLKPQNIFYSTKDNVMKIGDFGLATLGSSSPNRQKELSNQHSSNLGTLPYAAQEQRHGHNYNNKVDIYSLSIILIELLLHFQTQMEFCSSIDSISKGDIPNELLAKWPNYVFLVENLIKSNPNSRMSAKDILSLPLIQGKDNHEDLKETLLNLEQLIDQKERLIDEKMLIVDELIVEKERLIDEKKLIVDGLIDERERLIEKLSEQAIIITQLREQNELDRKTS